MDSSAYGAERVNRVLELIGDASEAVTVEGELVPVVEEAFQMGEETAAAEQDTGLRNYLWDKVLEVEIAYLGLAGPF